MASGAHILSGALLAGAFAAWLVAAWSFARAWLIAERNASFRALGAGRFFNWMGALRHMPPESRALLPRSFAAMAAFILLAAGAALLMALRAQS